MQDQLIKVGQWIAHKDGTFKARRFIKITADKRYCFIMRNGHKCYYTTNQLTDMLDKHWYIKS